MVEFTARDILQIVLGIVFVVFGVALANITNGIGLYVTNQFASAINLTPTDISIVSQSSVSGIVGAGMIMAGVALLGTAIGGMIKSLVGGVAEAANYVQ